MGSHRAPGGRHRAPEDDTKTTDLRLMFALILAILVAGAGLTAVLLTQTSEVPGAGVPVVVETSVPITTTAAPITPTADPRSTKEVWRSCQAQATGSSHRSTDATECMVDWSVGIFMSCITGDEVQCPTNRPGR